MERRESRGFLLTFRVSLTALESTPLQTDLRTRYTITSVWDTWHRNAVNKHEEKTKPLHFKDTQAYLTFRTIIL